MSKEIGTTEEVIVASLNSRQGKVKDFGEMKSFFPNNLRGGQINFLKVYFRGQLHIGKGKLVQAKGILDGLKKKKGWKEFQDENRSILALIDIAVRGETKQPIEGGLKRTSGVPGEYI